MAREVFVVCGCRRTRLFMGKHVYKVGSHLDGANEMAERAFGVILMMKTWPRWVFVESDGTSSGDDAASALARLLQVL